MADAPAEIDLPEGWDPVRPGGPLALLARPRARHSGPLRPSITVTHAVDPTLDGTEAYVAAQLAGARAAFGGWLVHWALGHRPESHLDLALAVDHLGVDATVVQRHLIRPGGRAVVATGVAADLDWPDLAPVVLRAVRSLRAAP